MSFSDSARDGFRRFLADRYGDVDALNDAWGNRFWAMRYRDWSEIDPPNLTATEIQIFRKIVVPLMRPAIAAMAVLVFTFVWNDYFWALVLVQSDSAQPITAGLQALKGQWVASWQLISAGSIVAALPPVLMFFLMQRHFIAGLTLGATKG